MARGGNRQAEVENEGTCRHGKYVANNCASTRIDEYSSHTGENYELCVFALRMVSIKHSKRSSNIQITTFFPKRG